ncbi:metallophosphoesterase family protein [Chloroflexota bacterium]
MSEPEPMKTLGVIADTHIPDRTPHLHPGVLPTFHQAGVEAILHAGDISTPRVISQLEQVAPVYAVRGNRDWIWLRNLPAARTFSYFGVPIVLTHGHGSLWDYLCNHLYILLRGYQPEQFVRPLMARFPDAKVIVFGHTHVPFNDWVEGRLLFNPGSPHNALKRQLAPSVGLLHISAEGQVVAESVELV